MAHFHEGQRVKTKPGKAFKRHRYGHVMMVIETPVYCLGSGKLTKKGEKAFLVNYGGESSYVYSASWIEPVKTREVACFDNV